MITALCVALVPMEFPTCATLTNRGRFVKVLIVGAGATGGYFGLRLAQAGRDVTFLVRPKRAAALRERGLRLVGLGHEEVVTPQLVTAAELDTQYDVVLLSVKATGLSQAMDDLAHAIGPTTVIVPFLNGMAHLDLLNERFGKEAVLGGVVKVVTSLNADGDIVQSAPLATFELGEQEGGTSARTKELTALLDVPGYEFAVNPAIVPAMWHKWVFIASVGAVTCLMGGTVGEVVAAGGSSFSRAVVAEAAAVSAAAGFPVPDVTPIETAVTQAGSSLTSSLYRDMTAGHSTEGEQILGDLVDRALRHDLATPLLNAARLRLRVHEQQRA
ncbi:ketopantoate reductase family protein [Streptomyces sp. NPDC001093]|uniref:ketopantoate reductase family protein n=1 Tax=Streptomyces sp. NPDC001093 TaxID=3154376 RepID=UPI0033244B43